MIIYIEREMYESMVFFKFTCVSRSFSVSIYNVCIYVYIVLPFSLSLSLYIYIYINRFICKRCAFEFDFKNVIFTFGNDKHQFTLEIQSSSFEFELLACRKYTYLYLSIPIYISLYLSTSFYTYLLSTSLYTYLHL